MSELAPPADRAEGRRRAASPAGSPLAGRAPDAAAPAPLRRPAVFDYAERPDAADGKLDRWGRRAAGAVVAQLGHRRTRSLHAILPQVARHCAAMAAASDDDLRLRAQTLRPELRRAMAAGRPDPRVIGPAFALVREAARRTLGMRHYDVQILGAWAMLRGMVAEMRTGEGKTLCATLAATAAALAGEPVHVITVNDYLAERDAALMGPLYRFLGLSVGVILAGQPAAERRAIYAADIVHGANKEIAFDYLRDRMALRRDPGNLRRKVARLARGGADAGLRMRGLHFAIVDEADSVLIDEARTPLIISGATDGPGGVDLDLFRAAMEVAGELVEGRDYRLPRNEHRVELLDAGKDRLEEIAERREGAFRIAVIREHAVSQALSALHLFRRDEHYILRDGKVQIVDEFTGRVQEDRSWSDGLHQMVELREGVEPTAPRETLARITYQRFFRRYGRLAGMTGTARDAAWELWSVYGLAAAPIPTNRPEARRLARDRVFASEAAKWTAIAHRVAALHAEGVPVLLGTRSVAASEKASAALGVLGVAHRVLNARQDGDEAGIVAQAGRKGQVTVATNMAGRGTDIKPGAGVAALGGLHVILSERHDSGRVDRQLAGRCGRQGDPGRVEVYLSLEDELLRGKGAAFLRGCARAAFLFGSRGAAVCLRLRQRKVERIHARIRYDLMEADRNLGNLLAVSGKME